MPIAVRFSEFGTEEVLSLEHKVAPNPVEGEVLVRHTAIGVNYIDVYHRKGVYPVPLPSGLGVEAAGVVEAVGPGVTGLKEGDRVAYAGGSPGAYSEVRAVGQNNLVKIPDAVSDEQAASTLLKGMTVRFLIKQTFAVKAGQTVLLHAAAGGVGLLACQWLKHLGVTVIGTVSSGEKADLARANGCAHAINYRRDNVTERVRDLTGGAGVPVVYNSVGNDTWNTSLDCLSPRGLLVSYGNTTGAVPPFNLGVLAAKGSLFVTRPTLASYVSTRAALEEAAGEVFAALADGVIKAQIGQTFSLEDVKKAHVALESGQTVGSTVLLPRT